MAHQTLTDMIEKKRANRYRILAALYEFTNGSTRHWVDLMALASEKGISGNDFRDAYFYLKGAKLIKPYGAGFTSYLTHEGIVAIEKATLHPDEESEHFPPVSDIGPLNGEAESL